jgi:CRISPR-associated protein Cas1
MLHRIVEVQEEGRYLSLDRGFLKLSCKERNLASVPLDDIAVLLVSAQNASFSKHILNKIAERGGISVLCGKNYLPQSIILPVSSHYLQAGLIQTQIAVSLPFKKNVWKQIVISKLTNQAKILSLTGNESVSGHIKKIAETVRSGDPDNREAYGARLYWKALFGNNFIRDKDGDGINALLNYGYAVARASIVRAVCAAGLLPSLGVHHNNKLNPFCLGDDLFEPFRPLVDITVFHLMEEAKMKINPEVKSRLAEVLWYKMETGEGSSPLFQSMHYMVSSFVKALDSKKAVLQIPEWDGNCERISSSEQI